MRLAVAALMASQLALPFVFDDPFLNCDEERLRHIRETLVSLGRERQVLLLSHRPDFAEWGAPVRRSA
ncbi:MAG: hypothetical protein IMX02_08345 [Limnochordaceae bacterium]|nr:hypothetical protein [Limnochordaceae bacterium]